MIGLYHKVGEVGIKLPFSAIVKIKMMLDNAPAVVKGCERGVKWEHTIGSSCKFITLDKYIIEINLYKKKFTIDLLFAIGKTIHHTNLVELFHKRQN